MSFYSIAPCCVWYSKPQCNEGKRLQFIFLDIILQRDSPISFCAEEKVRKEMSLYANYCWDETDGDRKPDNGIAIIVQAGLLALIKPYIREGESNGMEHDERQGEVSAKERGNRRVRDGIGTGWRSKIELERNEREVLGAVCWILEINTTYPISFSLVISRTMACVTHVHVHTPDTRHERRGDAVPIDSGFFTKSVSRSSFLDNEKWAKLCCIATNSLIVHFHFFFLYKINWRSDERGKSCD